MNNDLKRLITELEPDYEVELYVTKKTRTEQILTAGFVGLGFALWGLAIVAPLWWQRALCAAAYLLLAFAFDRTTRLRRGGMP